MKRYIPLPIIAAALLFAACATTKTAQKNGLANGEAGKNGGAAESAPAAPATEVTEASLRTGAFDPRADLKNVPFEYDSAKLSDDALAILKANADVIKADPSIEVLVAGNCDARGTTAYNLALGQKRAKEVRDYYSSLGIDAGRIATISYGKEKPLCAESTDACWATNRRAETLARVKAAAAAPAPAQ
ncbi:MAG TPA: OmpA family protein [Elusimicrobiota bacterium]|nr:OmpA family protein [Elusimicrobiota bacterium]